MTAIIGRYRREKARNYAAATLESGLPENLFRLQQEIRVMPEERRILPFIIETETLGDIFGFHYMAAISSADRSSYVGLIVKEKGQPSSRFRE